MTQYLLSVHGSVDAGEFGPYESHEQMMKAFEDTGRFNESLQERGHWVFAGGLMPAHTATVVDGTRDDVVVTDGPYLESKEHVGGFWVVEAKDLDEALALAAEGSRACRGAVEVRPFQSE
ncbi:YciI family protein [Nocardioides solisilvae]|uniref:YciI family protein n=1 Tax=Nocardioides solisilvae TaxID=1542435 RepID=UPI000D746961|nr:YciI family protein [Nocardioides solisilvae]